MGRICTLEASTGGRSEKGSSRLSENKPSPSERDLAALIQMYGCAAYSMRLVRTNSLSESDRMSYILYPLTNAVVPSGTSSSSPVPSS